MTATLPSGYRPIDSSLERGPELGKIDGVEKTFPKEFTLGMYRQTCYNRFFELAVADAVQAKHIRTPVYLSAGQEHIPAVLAPILGRTEIFAQHRAHSYYLSFGGDPAALVDELLGRITGCARSWGGSASIHDPSIGMWGHSGLMGDQVPIGVGYALATRKQTLIVVGDASGEEDYALAAMGYAATKKLPVLFVCEDNDLSILTPVNVRRSWSLPTVARSFGMPGVDITDDPWLVGHWTRELRDSLPAYLNIRTCRALWHAGAGSDGPPEWDRLELIKEKLDTLGLSEERKRIEAEEQEKVSTLWRERIEAPQ